MRQYLKPAADKTIKFWSYLKLDIITFLLKLLQGGLGNLAAYLDAIVGVLLWVTWSNQTWADALQGTKID